MRVIGGASITWATRRKSLSIRDGVRTARETAAQTVVLSEGVQSSRAVSWELEAGVGVMFELGTQIQRQPLLLSTTSSCTKPVTRFMSRFDGSKATGNAPLTSSLISR